MHMKTIYKGNYEIGLCSAGLHVKKYTQQKELWVPISVLTQSTFLAP